MKITINEYEFVKAFDDYNRSNNFSIEARRALYNYFCDLEDDVGMDIELDVIAICCEYTEYEDLKEFNEAYGVDFDNIDDIRDNTSVIEIDEKSFIIQSY